MLPLSNSECGGAAEALDVPPVTLNSKIKKLEITKHSSKYNADKSRRHPQKLCLYQAIDKVKNQFGVRKLVRGTGLSSG